MRIDSLLVAVTEKIGRRSKAVVATIALLIGGAAVLPFASTPAPTFTARLMSAGRVARAANGNGYWLVTADGKVFAFGSAHLYGSMVGRHLKAPITGIVATADFRGYWLVGRDGGVFSFGDAKFAGSTANRKLAAGVVGMASSSGGAVAGPSGAAGPAGVMGPDGMTGPDGATGNNGTNGIDGVTGTAGSNGTNGGTGSTGITGPSGSNGTNGATGPSGGNGSNGPTGPTGPAGAAGGGDFGYIYNTGAQTVALEGDITFSNTGPAIGFSHLNGAASLFAQDSGIYRINFSVSVVEPNQFGIFVNGSGMPGGIYGSGAGTQQNNGQLIVFLNSGDTVTLRNHSSAAAVTLQALAGGTQTNVNASIMIQQLSGALT